MLSVRCVAAEGEKIKLLIKRLHQGGAEKSCVHIPYTDDIFYALKSILRILA